MAEQWRSSSRKKEENAATLRNTSVTWWKIKEIVPDTKRQEFLELILTFHHSATV